MHRLSVVTDSTTDIPPGLAEELGILVAPMRVIINGKDYRDKVDISSEELYRLLPTVNPLPTTSGVTIEDFRQCFLEGLERTGCVLCLILSEKFSHMTLSAAHIARDMLGEPDITIVDTGTTVASEALIVLAAAKAIREGRTKEEVLALVNQLIPMVDTLVAIDTFKYLYKGGRVTGSQALLATLLNVKPILRVKDGCAVPIGRERSRSKAKAHMLRVVEGEVGASAEINVAIMHAVAYEEAEVFRDEIVARFRCRDVTILDNMGPTAGAHAGPGALGVGFYAL
jgi:DegV family protein with EDD domain